MMPLIFTSLVPLIRNFLCLILINYPGTINRRMSSSSDEERLSGDDRQVPLNEPVSPFFATPSGRNSPSLFIRALVGVSMIALVVFAWVAEAEYLQLVTVGSPETGSAYAKARSESSHSALI